LHHISRMEMCNSSTVHSTSVYDSTGFVDLL